MAKNDAVQTGEWVTLPYRGVNVPAEVGSPFWKMLTKTIEEENATKFSEARETLTAQIDEAIASILANVEDENVTANMVYVNRLDGNDMTFKGMDVESADDDDRFSTRLTHVKKIAIQKRARGVTGD